VRSGTENDAGRAPQVLAHLAEGLCQSAAPPGISGGARSGNRALRQRSYRLERLPMSTRNGTSSSLNPQPD
jgi:hypothetical protein